MSEENEKYENREFVESLEVVLVKVVSGWASFLTESYRNQLARDCAEASVAHISQLIAEKTNPSKDIGVIEFNAPQGSLACTARWCVNHFEEHNDHIEKIDDMRDDMRNLESEIIGSSNDGSKEAFMDFLRKVRDFVIRLPNQENALTQVDNAIGSVRWVFGEAVMALNTEERVQEEDMEDLMMFLQGNFLLVNNDELGYHFIAGEDADHQMKELWNGVTKFESLPVPQENKITLDDVVEAIVAEKSQAK